MKINPMTTSVASVVSSSATAAASAVSAAPTGTAALAQSPAGAPAKASSDQADSIIASLQALAGSVEFSVDKVAGLQVITIRDPKSGEVIRQLPSEEALKFARQMASGQGVLVNQSA